MSLIVPESSALPHTAWAVWHLPSTVNPRGTPLSPPRHCSGIRRCTRRTRTSQSRFEMSQLCVFARVRVRVRVCVYVVWFGKVCGGVVVVDRVFVCVCVCVCVRGMVWEGVCRGCGLDRVFVFVCVCVCVRGMVWEGVWRGCGLDPGGGVKS